MDDVEEAAGVVLVVQAALDERLDEALDGGDGGAKLVAGVGHEVAADVFQPAELGDVAQDDDHADRVVALVAGTLPEAARNRGSPSWMAISSWSGSEVERALSTNASRAGRRRTS